MTRKALICFLALFLIQAGRAQSLKDVLSQKYKDRVLALRTPFAHADQKFSSAGQLLNARSSDPWLLYGAFQVEKLNLSKDTLRLEGPRVALSYVKTTDRTFLTKLSKSAKVEIHLGHPLNSLDEAQELMDRVFFPEDEVTKHATPEFRRADDNTPDDQIFHVSKNAFRRPGDNAPEAAADRDKEGIVLPPRPTYTPEPEFSAQLATPSIREPWFWRSLLTKPEKFPGSGWRELWAWAWMKTPWKELNGGALIPLPVMASQSLLK